MPNNPSSLNGATGSLSYAFAALVGRAFVGLSGQISPRLREELEKRGMTVQDRLVPGPLKAISTREQRP